MKKRATGCHSNVLKLASVTTWRTIRTEVFITARNLLGLRTQKREFNFNMQRTDKDVYSLFQTYKTQKRLQQTEDLNDTGSATEVI